jgi:hypothetical protein
MDCTCNKIKPVCKPKPTTTTTTTTSTTTTTTGRI